MWRSGFRLVVCVVGSLASISAIAAEVRPSAKVEEKERVVEASPPPSQPWVPAAVGKELVLREKVRTGELSRATVRLSNEHLLRVNALSQLVIVPSLIAGTPLGLELQKGEIYLHSRGLPTELGLRTPTVTGTPRGTEFRVLVAADGTTTFTMFDGEVDLANVHGTLHLANNEQAIVEPGRAPRKTAVIEARNTIQWCLYYPGVLHVPELGLSATDARILRPSLEAYEHGDLLGALDQWPGRYHAESPGGKLYRAMVLLGVGQVDQTRKTLAGVAKDAQGRHAIEEMMDAVNFIERKADREPATAGEWLARSYYEQSRARLQPALVAARKATAIAPESGYAWARVAELLFSFGKTQDAAKALDQGLRLAPRNAQAHALSGFLLAAQNHIGDARQSFEQAIVLDGALANAWLGRGLTSIRKGREEEGRRDMQVAAALEPNRSILRSYLGKAASQVGSNAKANLELDRAKKLDPNDPTPWLYSAIQRKQENRYNEAVADLEKSLELNDSRRVYRSQFLLDQDRAVRSTNLANIYLKEGMEEQSVREAIRAVNKDYGSAAAHLFLANSYDALRDPNRVVLRYETAWLNELLLSNLLSPVGGGSLSQFVSQQEYSKLFEKNGFGMSSNFEYRSDGQVHETASQFGTFGNFSYALDADYRFMRGTRLNNRESNLEYTGTFKLQLGVADSILFQVKTEDLRAGDVFQYYDPKAVSSKTAFVFDEFGSQVFDANGNPVTQKVANQQNATYHLRDLESPGLLLLGWHHEWSPGNHTLLLLGRLAADQEITAKQVPLKIIARNGIGTTDDSAIADLDQSTLLFTPHFSQIRGLTGIGRIEDVTYSDFDLFKRTKLEVYSAELQQIATLGMQTLVLGGRYQGGRYDTTSVLSNLGNGTVENVILSSLVDYTASARRDIVNFDRVSLYLYDTVRLARWLSITGGVTYERMHYPDNFRNSPTNGRQNKLEKVLPKVGIVLEPWRGATVRAAYMEAISGTTFDESVRLEPTQVSGFLQSYRSLASESLIGSVAGSRYRLSGISFEQKLPTHTYFGIEYDRLIQNLDQTVGVYDWLLLNENILGYEPSSLPVKDHYTEDRLIITLNQLVGEHWALGARYRCTRSQFNETSPLSSSTANTQYTGAVDNLIKTSIRESANFHELSLYALYNHPCGLFARAEANWYQQSNANSITDGVQSYLDPDTSTIVPVFRTTNQGHPKSDFWQFNVLAGYRFHRNQCEISGGVLNLMGQDYRLNPVNPYNDMPRTRTFVVRCKLVF